MNAGSHAELRDPTAAAPMWREDVDHCGFPTATGQRLDEQPLPIAEQCTGRAAGEGGWQPHVVSTSLGRALVARAVGDGLDADMEYRAHRRTLLHRAARKAFEALRSQTRWSYAAIT